MGYYIFSKGIHLSRIKSVFASKDQTVAELIKSTPEFDNYNSDDFPGISTKTALNDIIDGAQYNENSGYQYGYAIISICAALGTELPYTQEIKLGYETDFINQYLAQSFNIANVAIEERLLPDNSNPFTIPPIEDWPIIGFLDKERLINLQILLSEITISDDEIEELENDDEEKGFAYQHIKGIKENIEYCIENDLEMISFCH